jgi:hypothetical protein
VGMKRRSSIDPTRLCEELTSIFEKTPAVEMQDMVRLFLGQRATSYEQRERLAESARACAARVADLANRISAPTSIADESMAAGATSMRRAPNTVRPCARSGPENLRPERGHSGVVLVPRRSLR